MTNFPCDTFDLPPLNYRSKGVSYEQLVMYAVLGGIVWMLMTMPKPSKNGPNYLQTVGATVTSMIANVAAPSSLPSASALHASFEAVPNVVLVGRKAYGKSPQETVSDAEKEKNLVLLRKWMKAHPDGVVVVFASWCGACHSLIDYLIQNVDAIGDTNLALLDYDTLPSRVFDKQSADRIVGLSYFPTLLTLTDNGTQASIVEASLASVLAEKKGSAAVSAKVSHNAPDDDRADDASEPLLDLNALF